ncbi:DUF1918 domain-containing protein [Thalassiella azotivora]
MRAAVGDRLTMHGKVVGQADEECEVVEVLGEDGGPPYRVRHADGHEGVLVPGPDTSVRSASG